MTTTAIKIPAKVQGFLDRAAAAGLKVEDLGNVSEYMELYSWAISSPVELDRYQLWLYWTPGRNGGRLTIRHYRGAFRSGGRRATANVNKAMASIILRGMIETVERAIARHQAAQA